MVERDLTHARNLSLATQNVQSLPHRMRILSPITPVTPGVSCVRDTCNVYVLRRDREAIAIDFGSGLVLDRLGELGVDRITDVLVTHHHRDQVQGLERAVEAGVRIWVPPIERELIENVERLWSRRQLENDYDLREDRFSLLRSVPVTGSVAEYRSRRYGPIEVYTLPTPGHTPGSVTYLADLDGKRLAFSGDLVYGDGKVWSLAATQWSYSGIEGQASAVISCRVLAEREPDRLLPSHGEPIGDPHVALAAVADRLQELLNMRREAPWDLENMRQSPWAPITPHLLRNRASFANSYALLSESGAALLIDAGYDVTTGLVPSTERAARRSLLWPVDALRRDHGVERIEVAIPTHYHDDHVAGLELLRDVEGTEVWAPEHVAPVLEHPEAYDLPCLWFEPIRVDQPLPLGTPVVWQEYALTVHPLPGHTLYAAAIEFEVDGKRVLATGDQQTDGERPILNYQYRNRFRLDDYVRTAELYESIRPDLVISGHWPPQEVTPELLERLAADGARLAELHRELLPEEVEFGPEGFGARIEPYRSRVPSGEQLELSVTVRNPFDRPEVATVRLVVPPGWPEPEAQEVELAARAEAPVRFSIDTTGAPPAERARIAADLTVGEARFGQQADAVVEVT
jgi:glyoxylase-like metal-dependent hydrolase (beta-lactamase superfamily II)